jgi:hypothetical protein
MVIVDACVDVGDADGGAGAETASFVDSRKCDGRLLDIRFQDIRAKKLAKSSTVEQRSHVFAEHGSIYCRPRIQIDPAVLFCRLDVLVFLDSLELVLACGRGRSNQIRGRFSNLPQRPRAVLLMERIDRLAVPEGDDKFHAGLGLGGNQEEDQQKE